MQIINWQWKFSGATLKQRNVSTRLHKERLNTATAVKQTDLSNAMLRVSSCVVTTGAESLAATCSSLGCAAPRRPILAVAVAAALLEASPFSRVGESAVRDETLRVSQQTSCLSWSTSITSALESEGQEEDLIIQYNLQVNVRTFKHSKDQRTWTLSLKYEAPVSSLPGHLLKAHKGGVHAETLAALPHPVGVAGADAGDKGHCGQMDRQADTR